MPSPFFSVKGQFTEMITLYVPLMTHNENPNQPMLRTHKAQRYRLNKWRLARLTPPPPVVSADLHVVHLAENVTLQTLNHRVNTQILLPYLGGTNPQEAQVLQHIITRSQ